jgi:predicted nuclease of restriction endonuclease-like RecB superfamily
MTIQYDNLDDFYEGVSRLVKLGLMFEANHQRLAITLTGGF